ncbi:PREDICTED: transcription factor bHLH99-like [Camelina sativa]|uniref:Transcription factor bHLH99-like n=1 Tax=Camelina sativa TaxID=90675 RepID=A0ABM0UQG2_CAMSA|nr:PREDICTED: transcription factor bHLH99-like [Camelina sativa]
MSWCLREHASREEFWLSLMETSLSYDILDFIQNIVVSKSQQNSLSSSSYSSTVSCSVTEQQQSHSTHKLASLRPRGGSSDHDYVPSRKRTRRTTSDKKIEDVENQRMNHIAVERNRRRQMNHFISVLKSMMPLSYSQPNDQASIIEGTINYLKKLEQLLHSLEAQLKARKPNRSPNKFSNFFMFPQYSTATTASSFSSSHKTVADVEVTMVERHANIKVLTKTQPRLLFKLINEFYSLGLSTLHLNLITANEMSLFTIGVKVEANCQLTPSINDVANAVHEVVRRIHKES